MLSVIGEASPRAHRLHRAAPIARTRPMDLPPGHHRGRAGRTQSHRGQEPAAQKFIGQGYYGTHTPGVILRNILENPPGTPPTRPTSRNLPGRMEALVNFQTMVCDLTGMPIANASMLDEATAAAEAMTLAKRSVKAKATCSWWRATAIPKPSK